MAVDFRPHGVAVLSIWMGAVLTERLRNVIASDPVKLGHLERTAETPEFTGHVVWALSRDPALMEMSGRTWIGAELARKYGILDAGGRQPPSYRDTHHVEPRVPYPLVIR